MPAGGETNNYQPTWSDNNGILIVDLSQVQNWRRGMSPVSAVRLSDSDNHAEEDTNTLPETTTSLAASKNLRSSTARFEKSSQ